MGVEVARLDWIMSCRRLGRRKTGVNFFMSVGGDGVCWMIVVVIIILYFYS